MAIQEYKEHLVEDSYFTKYYTKESITGRKGVIGSEILDANKDSIIGLTLENKSTFHLIPITYPEMFLRTGDEHHDKFIKMWLRGVCESAIAIDGIQTETLDVQTATFKSQFFFINMITQQTTPTQEITIQLPSEFQNYFFVKGTSYIMSQMSDPYSKAAPMCGSDLEFNNYSISMTIAMLKPSPDWKKLNWGCYFYMMIPIQAATDAWNADSQSPSITNISIPFKCNMIDIRVDKVREALNELLKEFSEFNVKDFTQQGIANGTGMDCLEEWNDMDRIREDYFEGNR